jgi:hypothetical protein
LEQGNSGSKAFIFKGRSRTSNWPRAPFFTSGSSSGALFHTEVPSPA